MKIDLKYNRPAPKTDKDKEEHLTDSELTQNYIDYAINSAYPNGAPSSQRRIFARIQRKLDEAIDTNKPTIDLEKAEHDLLKEIFDKAQFPGAASKYVVMLEDEINKKEETPSKK